MNSYKALSNQNLVSTLRSMIADERKITLQILHLINEAHSRRLYAEAGYPSLFEWLTKALGYSAPAAMRRIESARALREVPAIEKKIETGELNLTNLAKAQSVIRAEEKRTGGRLSLEKRTETFSLVEQKSSREVEAILVSAFPEAAKSIARPESVRPISETDVRVELTMTRKQLANLNRVRDLASHSHFGAALSEIIDMLASTYLEKNDPLLREVKPRPRKTLTAANALPAPEVTAHESAMPKQNHEPLRPLTRMSLAPSMRNAIFRKADGRCQFTDPRTGYRCESRHLLEVDHVVPVALGGTNDLLNLRVLCRTHNLAAAERILGKDLIQPYRCY